LGRKNSCFWLESLRKIAKMAAFLATFLCNKSAIFLNFEIFKMYLFCIFFNFKARALKIFAEFLPELFLIWAEIREPSLPARLDY